MGQPLISVIVPVYRAEQYLHKCVDSILNQTYSNLEVILVDDGSPDHCGEICDEYATKDARVRTLHKQNGGAAEARNFGLDISRGEWIGFIDSDDYIDLRMYETLMTAARGYSADMVCCDIYRVYADESIIRDFPFMPNIEFDSEQALASMLSHGVVGEGPVNKLYRKNLFQNVRFPVGEINEDIVILPELLRRCRKVQYVAEALYYYQQTENSVTRSKVLYSERDRVVIKHMRQIDAYVREYFPRLQSDSAAFQVRYAGGYVAKLQRNKEVRKQFPADYKEWRTILRKNYFKALGNTRLSARQKARGLALLLGLFRIYKGRPQRDGRRTASPA